MSLKKISPGLGSMLPALPIEKGGTGAKNTDDVSRVLGLVGLKDLNKPRHPMTTKDGWISEAQLPDDITIHILNVDGPRMVPAGTIGVYYIKNFTHLKNYEVETTRGSAVIENDTIQLYAPVTNGPLTLTLRDGEAESKFEIDIGAVPSTIDAPRIISPTANQNELGPVVFFQSSVLKFTGDTGDNIQQAKWQFSLDIEFNTGLIEIVKNEDEDPYNVSLDVEPGKTYYARVMYAGHNLGHSPWSPALKFSTRKSYIPKNEEAMLTPLDIEVARNMGRTVVVSGDKNTIVAGAPRGANRNHELVGEVYIYRKDLLDMWSLDTILTPENPKNNLRFGTSVAVSDEGDMVFVGVEGMDANEETAGEHGGMLTYRLVAGEYRLVHSWGLNGSMANVGFGKAISCSVRDGDGWVAVSRSGAFIPGFESVALLRVTDYTVTEASVLSPGVQPNITNSRPGSTLSLAVNGGEVVIVLGDAESFSGADRDIGSVHIARWDIAKNKWGRYDILTAEEPEKGECYGSGVSLSEDGKRLVVGSDHSRVTNSQGGKAYIYRLREGLYELETTLENPEPGLGSEFGTSVSNSHDGEIVAVADKGNRKVFVYQLSSDEGFKLVSTLEPEEAMNSSFGVAVDISPDGTVLVAGDDTEMRLGEPDVGRVYVYI